MICALFEEDGQVGWCQVGLGFVIIYGPHRMGGKINRSVNFIWCQFLTSCMGGYVISTLFSIVCEPKNSIMWLCITRACKYNDGCWRDITDQGTSVNLK